MREYDTQKKLFEWASGIPECKFMYCSSLPINLAFKERIRISKAGGVAGVPDICLPYPNEKYHGLYIELKNKSGKSGPTQKQRDFIKYLNSMKYKAIVCYGLEEAQIAILDYL